MNLEKRIKIFMQQEDLWPESGSLGVAVSGGVDSMVLLHLLNRVCEGRKLIVLHVNHGTRLACAEEEALVRKVAQDMGHPCVVKHWEAGNLVKNNFEKQARDMRYEFFAQESRVVATAHHLDDQFENFLLQTFRSSREGGYMEAKRDGVIRPLLFAKREEILQYAEKHGLSYFHDASNEDSRFDRNYVRLEIVSRIRSRFPGYLDCFQRQLEERKLAKDHLWLEVGASSDCLYWRYSGDDDPCMSLTFLQRQLERLVGHGRGSLHRQKAKLDQLLRNRKFFGPFTLAGGVTLWGGGGFLAILSQSEEERLWQRDGKVNFAQQETFYSFADFASSKDYSGQIFPSPLLLQSKDGKLLAGGTTHWWRKCWPQTLKMATQGDFTLAERAVVLEKWRYLIQIGKWAPEKKIGITLAIG